MGNFPAFFSWSNLRVWCSRSLNWYKMGLPQPDLAFQFLPHSCEHIHGMWAVWKVISFFLFGFFPSLFSGGLGFLVGFVLFSVKGIFCLCEVHYCEAAHSVTVQAPTPLFLGWKWLCSRWRMKAGWYPPQFVFRYTLFNNVDIRD